MEGGGGGISPENLRGGGVVLDGTRSFWVEGRENRAGKTLKPPLNIVETIKQSTSTMGKVGGIGGKIEKSPKGGHKKPWPRIVGLKSNLKKEQMCPNF